MTTHGREKQKPCRFHVDDIFASKQAVSNVSWKQRVKSLFQIPCRIFVGWSELEDLLGFSIQAPAHEWLREVSFDNPSNLWCWATWNGSNWPLSRFQTPESQISSNIMSGIFLFYVNAFVRIAKWVPLKGVERRNSNYLVIPVAQVACKYERGKKLFAVPNSITRGKVIETKLILACLISMFSFTKRLPFLWLACRVLEEWVPHEGVEWQNKNCICHSSRSRSL